MVKQDKFLFAAPSSVGISTTKKESCVEAEGWSWGWICGITLGLCRHGVLVHPGWSLGESKTEFWCIMGSWHSQAGVIQDMGLGAPRQFLIHLALPGWLEHW